MDDKTRETNEICNIFIEQLGKIKKMLLDGLKNLARLNNDINFKDFSNGGITYLVTYVSPHNGVEVTDLKYIHGKLYLYAKDTEVANIEDLDVNEIMLIYCSISEMMDEFVLS